MPNRLRRCSGSTDHKPIVQICPDFAVDREIHVKKPRRNLRGFFVTGLIGLAAGPHRATGGTEITAILADHRVVATFAAQLALGRQDLVAGRIFRGFENAHLLQRETLVIKDAEHAVAVDDQIGDVSHGRRVGLLLARTGYEGHEIAERLGVVNQLAQFHADPGRVKNAHVERQQLGQTIEGTRVIARKPHRIRAGNTIRQGDFLESEDEVFTGRGIVDVDRPGQRAVGTGLGLLGTEQGIPSLASGLRA